MSTPLIEKTAKYVKAKLIDECTGHDWHHVERVWKISKRLQKEEGGDKELIELAALLHDLGDYKQYEFNEIKGSLVLHGMMDVIDIDDKAQEKILDIVAESQFNGDDTKDPATIEAKIIRDADFLETLGAIGIARIFATGGRLRRVIHDPERKPRRKLKKYLYQRHARESTSINYFYEKALRLPDLLVTKTAKRIAEHRVEYIKDFLEEFFEEWRGER